VSRRPPRNETAPDDTSLTAEQKSDFKQRRLQDAHALLDAGTTRLDLGVPVAGSEKRVNATPLVAEAVGNMSTR
jgi:hypothetical protein